MVAFMVWLFSAFALRRSFAAFEILDAAFVGLCDPRQAVDTAGGFLKRRQNLSHCALQLAHINCEQFDALRQRLMAFGHLLKPFVDRHASILDLWPEWPQLQNPQYLALSANVQTRNLSRPARRAPTQRDGIEGGLPC